MSGELATYVGRIRQITRRDWVIYVAWVSTTLSLAEAVAAPPRFVPRRLARVG